MGIKVAFQEWTYKTQDGEGQYLVNNLDDLKSIESS